MGYTLWELMFFLFCYSFLGWCIEVLYMALRTGRFCNRGLLNLPLCLSYGLTMDLLILVIPTLEGAYVIQFIAFMVIVSACAQLADDVSVRVTGRRMWENEAHSIYSGEKLGVVYTLTMSAVALVVLLLIHPVLYVGSQMLPDFLLRIGVLLFRDCWRRTGLWCFIRSADGLWGMECRRCRKSLESRSGIWADG